MAQSPHGANIKYSWPTGPIKAYWCIFNDAPFLNIMHPCLLKTLTTPINYGTMVLWNYKLWHL